MSKLRVHDMAGEFGISADEVMGLLRTMDVPVRSHLSPLTDDQVARVRARWEREKRVRAEKQAAPAAPARRRRGAATAAVVPEPVTAPAESEAAGEASPVRRRRKAADVQAAADAAAEVAAAEAAATEAAEAARAAERAARAEREAADAAVAAARAEQAAAARAAAEAEERSAAEQRAAAEAAAAPVETERRGPADAPAAPRIETPRAASPSPLPPAAAGSDRPRPRPITPGAPRPRSVGAGSPFPPRPVASASPGGYGGPTRRDDRRPVGGGPQSGNPPTTGAGAGTASRGRKKGKRGSVDQEVVDANIAKTMASMRGAPTRGGRIDRRGMREEAEASRLAEVEREKKLVRVNEFITVSELAQILKVSPTEIVGFAFKNLGLMITVNQRLDFDQIEIVAGEFGFQAVREDEYQAEEVGTVVEDTPEDMKPRPPIVTIMGHVDHGKTSLLDYIRKANVVAGEAGGITQHIGAYHVELPGGKAITFLDTPGHQAFTAMRARGAQVTDIVVLVVAADDQVMPQTVEAISHAKNAGVPMIVAINKMDLPSANVQKVKQDLLQHNVVLEEFGGNVLSTPISAKKGTNVDQLLDQLLLQAEILDLKANPERAAQGTVLEATLDPGKGPLATILVQKGQLKQGDNFICGKFSGRVRAMYDERGKTVKQAGPSIPVQILGFEGVPAAGDNFAVVADANEAREIAQKRQRLEREAQNRRTTRGGTLEDLSRAMQEGLVGQLRLIIKADQGGPAEALADALAQLGTDEVRVDVVHRGVGAITESDILLAKASGAMVLGFHVRPDSNARAAAEREQVDVRTYRIIYEAVEDVRNALEGMLKPEEKETVLGEAQVQQLFKVSKVGTIAGCMVRSGIIQRTAKARVVRDGVTVYTGNLSSLKRFKDDVKEVREGLECGIGIENFNDLKAGDMIESFRMEEVKRTLTSSATTGAV